MKPQITQLASFKPDPNLNFPEIVIFYLSIVTFARGDVWPATIDETCFLAIFLKTDAIAESEANAATAPLSADPIIKRQPVEPSFCETL